MKSLSINVLDGLFKKGRNMKTIVVLPAYNCERTLRNTISDIPMNQVDDIVLVDDFSTDDTCNIAKEIGLKHIVKHPKNLGYGANQKTCYDYALSLNADLIIMLHPDYQYDPRLIIEIRKKIDSGAEVVFASRMIKGHSAIRNGMPIYKYISNRILTEFQNLILKKNLTEYHTGYRAYRSNVLKSMDYNSFSNDFVFDNQMIIEIFRGGFKIDEIYCPAKYENTSSSINFLRSVKYGLGVVYYTLKYKFNL